MNLKSNFMQVHQKYNSEGKTLENKFCCRILLPLTPLKFKLTRNKTKIANLVVLFQSLPFKLMSLKEDPRLAVPIVLRQKIDNKKNGSERLHLSYNYQKEESEYIVYIRKIKCLQQIYSIQCHTKNLKLFAVRLAIFQHLMT